MLNGGPRVEKAVVRCQVLVPNHATVSMSFGVELVKTDNDCGGGSDYRIP